MTPRQLRLINPMTKQPPAKALANVVTAYLIWPLCIVEAASAAYLAELQHMLAAQPGT